MWTRIKQSLFINRPVDSFGHVLYADPLGIAPLEAVSGPDRKEVASGWVCMMECD